MKKTNDNACKCVIVAISDSEKARLDDLESRFGLAAVQEEMKPLFAARDWWPDADCKICEGTGFPIKKEESR